MLSPRPGGQDGAKRGQSSLDELSPPALISPPRQPYTPVPPSLALSPSLRLQRRLSSHGRRVLRLRAAPSLARSPPPPPVLFALGTWPSRPALLRACALPPRAAGPPRRSRPLCRDCIASLSTDERVPQSLHPAHETRSAAAIVESTLLPRSPASAPHPLPPR